MPIINISATPPGDSSGILQMMRDVRDAGAEALKTPRDNVWVTFNSFEHYINGTGAKDFEPRRPIVVVKAQAGRSLSERTDFLRAISLSIARGLTVSPLDVWIYYEEMDPQNVWFEGHWATVKEIPLKLSQEKQ